MSEPITPEDLAAARKLFAGLLAECPHCGGWSRHDPRHAPVHCDPVICLGEPRDAWYVRCFSCFACTTSTAGAAEAVARWNRRTGANAQRTELLALVDMRRAAERAGMELTRELEALLLVVQRDVLSLNQRPL